MVYLLNKLPVFHQSVLYFLSSSSLDLTEVPLFSEWYSAPPANHMEVMVQAKLSGGSLCSDTVSQGSGASGRSTELVLGRYWTEF